MSEHECIIGMLSYSYDDTRLVTVNELLKNIQTDYNHYDYLCNLYVQYNLDKPKTPYTLKDYADRRKSTNLTRFEFCPYCGKKIDWKRIKNEEDNAK